MRMNADKFTTLELIEMISSLPEPGTGADAKRGKQFLLGLLVDYDREALFDFMKQVDGAKKEQTKLTLDDLERRELYLLRKLRKPAVSRRHMLLSTATIGGLGAFLIGDGAARFLANAQVPAAKETISLQHLRETVDSEEVVAGGLLVGTAIHAVGHTVSMEERLRSAVRAAEALLAEQETRAQQGRER